MEKYGTFDVYKNIKTNEIKTVPLTEVQEFEKTAENMSVWKKLDSEVDLGEIRQSGLYPEEIG